MSGVAITFAGALEDAGLREQAYITYQRGLLHMVDRASESPQNLTLPDKIRALSIAYKLGELANTLKRPLAEEEKWLTLSAEALLGIMPQGAAHRKVEQKTFEELELPSWAMLNDFSAPFEALGSYYARTGKPECVRFCGNFVALLILLLGTRRYCTCRQLLLSFPTPGCLQPSRVNAEVGF